MSAPPLASEPAGARSALPYAVAALALVAMIAGTLFGPYGYFIDELYYIACAKRLAWGYVDHPPLSILLLAAVRSVLGESLLALRLLPALAAAGAALVGGLLARRLGGGSFAQALAALAVATAPVSLVLGTFYSMNAFELLLWPVVGLVLLSTLGRDAPRGWLLVGALLGLGLENKHTTVLLGGAIAAGLMATRARRHLATPWPWLGGLIALLILLPNLAWQQANGWPSLEFYRNAELLKNVPTPPMKVVADQVLFLGPGSLPIWVAGVLFLLLSRRAAPYRMVAIAFLALFAALIASRSSRPDRIAAFYPILFAAGGVALESLTTGRRWMRTLLLLLLLAGAGIVLPMSLPLLPPQTVAAYAQAIGFLPKLERGKTSPIPQWLADRTGWEELVNDVASAYRTLSPEDQAKAVLYAPSYGQAGALELFGPSRGLPARILCRQNSYWMWSKALAGPQVLIAVDASPRDLDTAFAEHARVGVHHCQYCMSWRNDAPIDVARGLRVPWRAAWATTKHYE